jgi:hypothetical protein
VGKVGTDLHTTDFDPETAQLLTDTVSPYGSLIKGHYTDWVSNPYDYPAVGMGGANVGPEFTSEEYMALADLSVKEDELFRDRETTGTSNFMTVLEAAVFDSGRWQKWLQPDEHPIEAGGLGSRDAQRVWNGLTPERRSWLTQTGARYVWTVPTVLAARETLYHNVSPVISDPHQAVVDRIAQSMQKYVVAFNLSDSLVTLLTDEKNVL